MTKIENKNLKNFFFTLLEKTKVELQKYERETYYTVDSYFESLDFLLQEHSKDLRNSVSKTFLDKK